MTLNAYIFHTQNMDLDHRCFKGTSFRPTPTCFIQSELNFFTILTPWGIPSKCKEVLNVLIQNYTSFSTDEDKTTLHSKLHSMSSAENNLRQIVLACNSWIFKNQNKSTECSFAYELVCGYLKNDLLIFLQVGQPYIYLDRPGLPLQSLGHVLDLSGSLAKSTQRLAPLPSSLIGIYPDTHFSVFSLPIHQADRLLFISRDFTPCLNLDDNKSKKSLQDILKILISENKDQALWLGYLSF